MRRYYPLKVFAQQHKKKVNTHTRQNYGILLENIVYLYRKLTNTQKKPQHSVSNMHFTSIILVGFEQTTKRVKMCFISNIQRTRLRCLQRPILRRGGPPHASLYLQCSDNYSQHGGLTLGTG